MIARSVRTAVALLLAASGLGLSATATEPTPPVRTEPQAAGAVPLAIVAPLALPAGDSGLLDAEALEEYTQQGGLLDRQLTAMESTSVTIGIDPRILASIRVLGRDAPDSATEWLDRLAAAPNDTFELAWADADLAAPLHAGAEEVLAPKSLEFAIDPARFDPASDGSGETPAPTSAPVTLPEPDDLTAWDYTIPSLAWPAANSLVEGDLLRLTESGFTRVILHSSEVGRLDSEAVAGASTLVEGVPVATADATISEHLSESVGASSTADWLAATQQLSGALAALNHPVQADSPIVLAVLDRSWESSSYRLDQTVDLLLQESRITEATLSEVFDQESVAGVFTGNPLDEVRVERVRQLLNAEAMEVRYSAIAEDPVELVSPRRLQLLALLSNAWQDDQEDWLEATDAFLTESKAIRSSVQIVDSSTINLFADRAALPVTVSNTLDQPVTVHITARPQSAILVVEDPLVELTIEPNSRSRGSIPVTSLSNGEVEVSVHLYGPAGNQIGEATEVELNVQAGWETAGTLAFAALVVAVFAFGLVRNIRKRRRALRG